jgi:NlpC/P60 family
MGRLRMFLALAVLACVIPAQASAASTTTVPDVPASFWAHAQIVWAVKAGWVPLHKNGTFAPARNATRAAAARVLSTLNEQQHGVAISSDPFQQAVDGGWIGAGLGPGSTLTQLEFDRGIVRVMGLKKDSIRLRQITAADGWQPKLPTGFAAEQIVRDIGARWNVPFGADNWETWPSTTLRRANLAVQAYLLGHLPSYWQSSVDTQMNVVHALPTYPPLKKAVLGYALKWSGAPYIWGGSSDQPQAPFGLAAAAGFDCSGFVWWVMKRSYTVPGKTWDGTAKIPWRTTYDMAAHLPVAKRIPYRSLKPGDILFWSSSAPHGVLTNSSAVDHTGIYLGKGWTINSHGSGAGVTINYMGPGAGWYRDNFVFGWRIMPRGI